MIVIRIDKHEEFIDIINSNVVEESFINECREISKMFKREDIVSKNNAFIITDRETHDRVINAERCDKLDEILEKVKLVK